MREINEISTAMAKGFAAEMTEKMNNGMLKKGCPIMRGVLTVKSGKETEIREGVKRVSITVKVNYPFNILKPSNRRIEVIVENGELRNVKEIMYVALDAINNIASDIVTYTKGYWFDIDSKCYPDFVPTIEKYGIEWFERSIADFYDYLTGFEGEANEAVAEEEVYSAPELDEEIEKIADEVFDELNPDFGKWVDGEEVETGFGNGWIDGEWAWEDDGARPKAPADPEMRNWMESLGCVFEDEDDDIDENGYSIDGLKYVNKNMETVDMDMIKECIYEMVEDDYVEGGWKINFEEFCDRLWTDYVWEKVLDSGCTDEALEAETRHVMGFNDRVRYIVEHGIVDGIENMYITDDDEVSIDEPTEEEQELIDDIISTVADEGYWYSCLEKEKAILNKYLDINDDLGCYEFIVKGDYYHLIDVDIIEQNIIDAIVAEAEDDCVVDVSGAWDEYSDYIEYLNWDYISQRVADEFTDAKLEGDYLFNYWECADAIYKAVDRHGDDIKHGRLKLNWDELDEDLAYYMVADDEFAEEVMSNLEEWMDIEEWLVYDDALYLKLPDDEEEVAPVQSVEDYIMDISSRPSYVKKENITIEYGSDYVEVGLFGSFFVKLYNDDVHAAAYCSEGLAWGKEDLMFAYDIMDYKSHIWAIVNENRKRAA